MFELNIRNSVLDQLLILDIKVVTAKNCPHMMSAVFCIFISLISDTHLYIHLSSKEKGKNKVFKGVEKLSR